MSPEAFSRAIQQLLVDHPLVTAATLSRERITVDSVFLRGTAVFVDDSTLAFAIYNTVDAADELRSEKYSYHWMDSDNRLRSRWDNAPHYPDLSGFPHHVHIGDEATVRPHQAMTLEDVLAAIAETIAAES